MLDQSEGQASIDGAFCALSAGRIGQKSDVYSFGVILLELLTGQMPVDASRPVGNQMLVDEILPMLREGDLPALQVQASLSSERQATRPLDHHIRPHFMDHSTPALKYRNLGQLFWKAYIISYPQKQDPPGRK